MKKLLTSILAIIFTVCLAFSLVGCGDANVTPPSAVNGADTVMTGLKKPPDSYDANTAVYAALGKLESYTTYKSQSSGTSTARKGIVSYTQTTNAVTIKHGDEYYTDTESHSAFVNFRHEAFAKNNNVAYRVNDGDIKNVLRSSYESVYGITPAKLLTGHIYNQNTIVSVTGQKVNSNYQYAVTLDKNESNAGLSRQMKEFGGLGGYPVFNEDPVVTIVVREDFTPVSATYVSKYTVNVPVLGDMDCFETNTITFSHFNGNVEIPDTEDFNAAMNSTPSVIDPNKTAEKSGLDKIAASLVNLNFRDGITLTGSIFYNDLSVPFKLSGKADVDGLVDGTKKTSEAFDFTLSVITFDGNMSVTYHDGTFYADVAGKKLAFSADVSAVGGLELNLNDAGSIVSALKKVLTVEQSETEKDTYIITPAKELKDVICAALIKAEVITEAEAESFSFTVKAYMPDDKINAVYATMSTNEKKAGLSATIANELYTLPGSFDDYETKLAFGADVSLSLSPSLFGGVDFEVNCNLSFAYDTSVSDPVKAFRAEAKIILGDALKSILALVPSMMPDAPALLALAGSADEMLVDYKDGAIYVAFVADGKAIYVNKVELPETDFATQTAETYSSDDLSTITALLSELIEFDYDKETNIFTIAFKQNVIDLINSVFMNELPDAVFDKLGETGALLLMFLDLSNPLAGVNVQYNVENGALSLNVDMESVGMDYVYNPNAEYEKNILFTLGLKGNDDISDFSFDFETALSDDALAAPVREGISELKGVIYTDENAQKFAYLKAAYESLTENSKLLVYNYESLSGYENSAKSDKAAVDKFAASKEKKNYAYDNFTDEQKEYFVTAYAEIANSYFEARYEEEKTKVQEINKAINELDTVVENLTIEQLIGLIKKVSGIMTKIESLGEQSASDVDTANLNAAAKTIIDKYAELIKAEAEPLLAELKEMNQAFDKQSTFNKTVDEMIAFYEKYSEFYTERCENLEDYKAWKLMTENHSDVLSCCMKVNYYISTGRGFKTGAVKTIIDAIDSLDSATMTTEQLTAAIGKIETLMGIVEDENAITNLKKLEEIKTSVAS